LLPPVFALKNQYAKRGASLRIDSASTAEVNRACAGQSTIRIDGDAASAFDPGARERHGAATRSAHGVANEHRPAE
jgi:hypothetical protein